MGGPEMPMERLQRQGSGIPSHKHGAKLTERSVSGHLSGRASKGPGGSRLAGRARSDGKKSTM